MQKALGQREHGYWKMRRKNSVVKPKGGRDGKS